MKETDLAKKFIESVSEDWEIYQEVVSPVGRTDIVLKNGNILWAVEVKTSMNLVLIDQAIENLRYYNYSSVVIPRPKKIDDRGIIRAKKLLRAHGVGVFLVSKTTNQINEDIKPALHRKAMTKNIYLTNEQKTWVEAGTNKGGYYTPFANTKNLFIDYVRKNPGCTYKEAIENIEHHYRSKQTARSCLGNYVSTGVIKEIQHTKEGLFFIEKKENVPKQIGISAMVSQIESSTAQ